MISLLLSALIVVSLFAGCTDSGSDETTAPENNHTLSVGFGRTNISPTESVPLGGYGNTSTRMSQSIKDEIYATCIAISDETGNAILLYGGANRFITPAMASEILSHFAPGDCVLLQNEISCGIKLSFCGFF